MLEIKGLTGGYGSTTVVRDVYLSCPAGSVTALLGPNGAGKTTTLRLVAGLLRSEKGTVSFAGEDVGGLAPYKRASKGMCLIPEGNAIFPSLTVRDNLIICAGRTSDKTAITEAVHAFPALKSRLEQRAGTMSGGEQRMLAMARAYIQKPKLIIVDEPSLGLAPVIVDQIFRFLRLLAQEGGALLVVEQYVHKVLAMADHVCVMARGQVAFAGNAAEIGDRADLLGSYLSG
jgi:branched-chain amino acid transport system ATP-binding protein